MSDSIDNDMMRLVIQERDYERLRGNRLQAKVEELEAASLEDNHQLLGYAIKVNRLEERLSVVDEVIETLHAEGLICDDPDCIQCPTLIKPILERIKGENE